MLLWIVFAVLVLIPLAVDLGLFQRKSHVIEMKEALIWSAVWIGISLLFCAGVWWQRGQEIALQFLAGYLIEKSLSVDNIFVFALVFQTFRVPREHQHRTLFWGILGALVMRALLIAAGTTLISRFEWLFYVLGAFLVYTGVQMVLHSEIDVHPEKNILVRLFTRVFPVSHENPHGHFFVRSNGHLMATPLLVALVAIEGTDLVFALDSVPAVFAVTTDPFVVYTSNIFAILGLRALYFALAGMMSQFRHLRHGLAAVLIFVGLKMALKHFYEIPIGPALGVIVVILAVSVWTSLRADLREAAARKARGKRQLPKS